MIGSVIALGLRCLKDFFTQWCTFNSLITKGHILHHPLPRVPKSGELSSLRGAVSETFQCYFNLQMNLYSLTVDASLSRGKRKLSSFPSKSQILIIKRIFLPIVSRGVFFPIIVNIEHFRYISLNKKFLFMQIRSAAVTGTENQ